LATRSSQKTRRRGTSGAFRRCFGMATQGNNRMNGKGTPHPMTDAPHRQQGSFPGTGSDQWHRTLTGRQAPEPVGAKLRMIYGNIVSEQLPENMLDLLSQLDQKSSKQ
jgi:hypothetical protein